MRPNGSTVHATDPAIVTDDLSSMPVGDVGERALIARLQRQLPPAPDWMLLGIGDDAAVVEPERNRVEVLSVDALVEGVHFDRAFVPPQAIGHRALAVNLSDLAAMGAEPRMALLSFVVPSTLSVAEFDGITSGLVAVARRYGVHVAGGNLTRSPGPLMLDITVVGHTKRRQALTRAGASAGDGIYVSGTLGAAAAGLQMLAAGTVSDTTPEGVHAEPCAERYLYPEPRVRLGLQLARNRAAAACIDLSDGCVDGLHRIAEASGVGATIDVAALPIEVDARRWFESRGLDPVHEALSRGDDYELLVAVRPRHRGRLATALRHAGTPLTRIGTWTAAPGVRVRVGDGPSAIERELPRVGYDHFR